MSAPNHSLQRTGVVPSRLRQSLKRQAFGADLSYPRRA